MAITATTNHVKMVLKCDKGSQTLSKMSESASDEQFYAFGKLFATLEAHELDGITKVITKTLTF